ncbi:MAG: lysylphosphatidylglycerol synthase domain-containing protein [Acidobacteriota bacterium]
MNRDRASLKLSIAWSYLFAVLLMLFIFLFLVPDADGPSPWDGRAFRAGVLELFANFRLLDDMADLGIVRIADVGKGWLDADLDLIAVSDRRFGWLPFYLAVALAMGALLLRAIRQRLLAAHLGADGSARGLMSSYFFGRGMNLLFPFGPGEAGAARSMVDAGLSAADAAEVMFDNRLCELLAIIAGLVVGFTYLGWNQAIVPACWAFALVLAVVSLTRPLGRAEAEGHRFNLIRHLWSALNGPALAAAARRLSGSPSVMASALVLSVVALGVELLAYWCIKQAFSSPLDDYVLMKDLAFVPFALVIVVANTARVLPYTFASLGVYELVSVTMFRVFDQSFLGGTTVTLLDSALINTTSLVAFGVVLWLGRCPSVFETWRAFVAVSEGEQPAEAS